MKKCFEKLNPTIKHRLVYPKSAGELPANSYLVYILLFNKKPIVVGHGKKNRAKVIFDSKEKTTGHIKALHIRLHILFGGKKAVFKRCIIRCKSKEEAKKIEAEVHKCGGNDLGLPKGIETKLFDGIKEHSPAWVALKMAVCSAYGGILDLKRWRKKRILDNKTWEQIAEKLVFKSA